MSSFNLNSYNVNNFKDLVNVLKFEYSAYDEELASKIQELVDMGRLPTFNEAYYLIYTNKQPAADAIHKALLTRDKFLFELSKPSDAADAVLYIKNKYFMSALGFSYVLSEAIRNGTDPIKLGAEIFKQTQRIIVPLRSIFSYQRNQVFKSLQKLLNKSNFKDNILDLYDVMQRSQALKDVLGTHNYYQCELADSGYRIKVSQQDLKNRLNELHAEGKYVSCNEDQLAQLCEDKMLVGSCFDRSIQHRRSKRIKTVGPTYSILNTIEERSKQAAKSCQVTIRTCTNPNDAEFVEKMKQLEIADTDSFVYHPLKIGCPHYLRVKDTTIYAIAYDTTSKTLCGSLRATIYPTKLACEIEYLASKANTDPKYKGTGNRLLDALVMYLRTNTDVRYIYLVYDDRAKGFYLKYGFIDYVTSNTLFLDIRTNNNNLFYSLREFLDFGMFQLPSDATDEYIMSLEPFQELAKISETTNIEKINKFVVRLIHRTPAKNLEAVVNALVLCLQQLDKPLIVDILMALNERMEELEKAN